MSHDCVDGASERTSVVRLLGVEVYAHPKQQNNKTTSLQTKYKLIVYTEYWIISRQKEEKDTGGKKKIGIALESKNIRSCPGSNRGTFSVLTRCHNQLDHKTR